MQGYLNLNKLIMQAEKMSIWKAILVGIKIALILIPSVLIGRFILGY